jgi:hypothetical protein
MNYSDSGTYIQVEIGLTGKLIFVVMTFFSELWKYDTVICCDFNFKHLHEPQIPMPIINCLRLYVHDVHVRTLNARKYRTYSSICFEVVMKLSFYTDKNVNIENRSKNLRSKPLFDQENGCRN